jgi:hypothetical protein
MPCERNKEMGRITQKIRNGKEAKAQMRNGKAATPAPCPWSKI